MYSPWTPRIFGVFLAAALAATASTSSRAQSFTGLGFVSGANSSGAIQMSTNGMVVVGDSPITSFPAQAFRWTDATGMVGLANLSGQSVSEGLGVNADGTVVVGYDGFGGCGNNVAFRWTQATGQVSLGFPPGGNFSIAYATNADGTVVVGDAGVCPPIKPAGGPPRLVGCPLLIYQEPNVPKRSA